MPEKMSDKSLEEIKAGESSLKSLKSVRFLNSEVSDLLHERSLVRPNLMGSSWWNTDDCGRLLEEGRSPSLNPPLRERPVAFDELELRGREVG